MGRWLMSGLFLIGLVSCSKPPDLEAPCHEFGKFCAQYPINEEPIQGDNHDKP